MRIDSLTQALPSLSQAQPVDASSPTGSFSDVLKGAVSEVDRLQKAADDQAQQLATGQAQDVHQVMLSLEEAKMGVELLVQARNKVLDAYQEIMRQQI